MLPLSCPRIFSRTFRPTLSPQKEKAISIPEYSFPHQLSPIKSPWRSHFFSFSITPLNAFPITRSKVLSNPFNCSSDKISLMASFTSLHFSFFIWLLSRISSILIILTNHHLPFSSFPLLSPIHPLGLLSPAGSQ